VHDKKVRRRRAVLALLVGISLISLTAYFGESPSSPLHSVQRGIVEVLSPIQEGASKVLTPFKDVGNFFSGLFSAKSRAKRLQNELYTLESRYAQLKQEVIDDAQLRQEVGLDQSHGIAAYHPVGADVFVKSPNLWYATIEVDKGTDDGVRIDDPVLGDGALVGKVTNAGSTFSVVTLITDHTFGVAAEVQEQGSNSDEGVLGPQIGNPNQLLLSSLPKPAPGQQIPAGGEQVVTAGYTDPSNPTLDSLYPAGIPIGTVSSPVDTNNLDNNGQITVSPQADLRHLSFVQILTSPPNSSSLRAQVP
jgi:rod shape-determining protein MreC